MKKGRAYLEAARLKGKVYVFVSLNSYRDKIKIVEKYSPSSYEWSKTAKLLDNHLDQELANCGLRRKNLQSAST